MNDDGYGMEMEMEPVQDYGMQQVYARLSRVERRMDRILRALAEHGVEIDDEDDEEDDDENVDA